MNDRSSFAFTIKMGTGVRNLLEVKRRFTPAIRCQKLCVSGYPLSSILNHSRPFPFYLYRLRERFLCPIARLRRFQLVHRTFFARSSGRSNSAQNMLASSRHVFFAKQYHVKYRVIERRLLLGESICASVPIFFVSENKLMYFPWQFISQRVKVGIRGVRWIMVN